jgi:hypothetical protein
MHIKGRVCIARVCIAGVSQAMGRLQTQQARPTGEQGNALAVLPDIGLVATDVSVAHPRAATYMRAAAQTNGDPVAFQGSRLVHVGTSSLPSPKASLSQTSPSPTLFPSTPSRQRQQRRERQQREGNSTSERPTRVWTSMRRRSCCSRWRATGTLDSLQVEGRGRRAWWNVACILRSGHLERDYRRVVQGQLPA